MYLTHYITTKCHENRDLIRIDPTNRSSMINQKVFNQVYGGGNSLENVGGPSKDSLLDLVKYEQMDRRGKGSVLQSLRTAEAQV